MSEPQSTLEPARRVLVIAYHFPPVGGGGVQRTLKFVRYLRDEGYAATVITGPGDDAGRYWEPRDETLLHELPSETTVIRLAGPVPRKATRMQRWLRLESAYSRWWVHGVVEAGRLLSDIDLVFATMSPYESSEAAARLSVILDRPWVADLRDPWALDEMYVAPTIAHRRLELRRMRRALSGAAAVIMNTQEAASRVLSVAPDIRGRRVIAIPNGFDPADFERPNPVRRDGVFRVVHTGYLHTDLGRATRRAFWSRWLGGAVRGVDILTRSHVYFLQALERVMAERSDANLQVHFAGVTSRGDEAAIGDPRVVVHGYLTHEQSVSLVRSADLLFLPMHDLPEGSRALMVPGKTYEYLASGRPILAAVPDGDARDLLRSAGTACLCRPSDVEAIASCLRQHLDRFLRGDPSVPLVAGVLDAYERPRQAGVLAGVFDGILDPLESVNPGLSHNDDARLR